MKNRKDTFSPDAVYVPTLIGALLILIMAFSAMIVAVQVPLQLDYAFVQRMLLSGGIVALLMPVLFVHRALSTFKPPFSWLKKADWTIEVWCCYWGPDHVMRLQSRVIRTWFIVAYIRMRFLALEVDWLAPNDYGVNYRISAPPAN